jgi:hypothetical protein
MIALPARIARLFEGLGTPWTTGITAAVPHSGQAGVCLDFRRRLVFAGMRVMSGTKHLIDAISLSPV